MTYYSELSEDDRKKSYSFIEDFILKKVPDWSQWNSSINTDSVEQAFRKEIEAMEERDFEFLILHSGYIPDYYGSDSSAETLYSKLTESLVCQWAKRVGFKDSYLQTQKSNKEDITIKLDDKIIVCDAKSFRLGRSQPAPNVKDVIKKQAYETWLNCYDEKSRIGGLTTFPSLHDWKNKGEAYSYYTEGNPSIMLLFYEQMAYMLNQNIKADKIIEFLNSYNTYFTKASKDKSLYWNAVIKNLFKKDTYNEYMKEAQKYLVEKVDAALQALKDKSQSIEKSIKEELKNKTSQELRDIAFKARLKIESAGIQSQIKNIEKFRK